MPDPDPPSGAPLSERDADRLSERFTASWDEPEPVTADPATIPRAPAAPEPAVPPPAAAAPPQAAAPEPAAPPPEAAPPITPVAITAAKPKATLLGIAPIVVGPSEPPPAPAPAAAAAPAPMPAPPATSAATATPVPAAAAAAAAPPAAGPAAAAPPPPPAPLPPPPPAPLPPPPSSSPDASSVAQGLTTPAKPYIPKDDPSTPAVVISDAALAAGAAEQARVERNRITQTIPAHVRSSPVATAAPLGAVASSPVASSAIDDTYPPIRRRGSKVPALLGVLVLAAAGVVGYMKFGGPGGPKDATQTSSAPTAEVTPPPASEPTPPSQEPVIAADPPSPPSAQAAAEAPAPEPPVAEPPAPAKKGKARKPAPVRRPPSQPKVASSPAPEPAPAPAPKPAKGVIVRETPF